MRHLGILLSTLLYFDLSWKGVSGECQGDYDLYFVIDRYLFDGSGVLLKFSKQLERG